MIFERVVRPALFRLGGGDAETAHEWTLRQLAALARRPAALSALRARYATEAPVEAFDVKFPNPVGLGAVLVRGCWVRSEVAARGRVRDPRTGRQRPEPR